MYLVLIAWIYVAFMMAIAEATSPVGSLLGAAFTFLLYGVLPMSIVGYIMGTPARRRAIKAKQATELAHTGNANGVRTGDGDAASVAPNAHSETTSHAITPVRKKP
jgi:membrane protein implicated in regulation of membrane protease activity